MSDDGLDNIAPNRRVANDASFAYLVSPRFELRLDEQNPIGAVSSKRADLARYGPQGDEGEIGDDKVERRSEMLWICVADICPLDDLDPRIVANAPVKLSVADVKRHNAGYVALEHAVGESSGRRTYIDCSSVRDVEGEGRESGFKFLARPAHEGARAADEVNSVVWRNQR